uniref:thrombomodulin-like n=1 Tax=Doryrhamphus excisus TaxID=161450 RepID=UPI0025ADD442|nr:thrombomodulin-like [Doryrhamphus excisus]
MIAFFICALSFCGFLESVHTQRGRCVANQCFALLLDTRDFQGARESCRNASGELSSSVDVKNQEYLMNGISGSFWVGSPDQCTSFTAGMGGMTFQNTPCGQKLDGYVCQYSIVEPCGAVSTGRGADVRYTAPMGIALNHTFPQGTVAVVGKAGAVHPDEKFLCFDRNWLQAPWICEVMEGGCEHSCNRTSGCTCPFGQHLHANRITCTEPPQELDNRTVTCQAGFEPSRDGSSCVDVDECALRDECTEEGEECVNTRGAFECVCKDGFVDEDGVCVDVRICEKCEHMMCDKSDGVYVCGCHKGFRVSARDPTRCEMHCDKADCPANCVTNTDVDSQDMHQCFCPEGYIQDLHNNTPYCTDINECEIQMQCEHTCTNLFGGFECSCNEGYTLFDGYMCVHPEEDYAWDATQPQPTPAKSYPAAAVPSYIKTGSVLGISVFVLLCLVMLYFLVRNMAKRCGSLDLSSIKRPDMDIFYLQQVTTETYKRLSFDKQLKSDSQRF